MELTRSDYIILNFLKSNHYTTKLESATLQEIMHITNNTRPTTYRKMMNLCDQKYVGKGCKAVNADTFYLLEKGMKVVKSIGEEKEIPCSDKNGNIQGIAKIRDETKLNGSIRVQLDFSGYIEPSVKDEMIRELKEFVKKYYL